jgi:predicted membrane chloride channel (bestrophin family)
MKPVQELILRAINVAVHEGAYSADEQSQMHRELLRLAAFTWRTQADEQPPNEDVLEKVIDSDTGETMFVRVKNGELLYSNSEWMRIPA